MNRNLNLENHLGNYKITYDVLNVVSKGVNKNKYSDRNASVLLRDLIYSSYHIEPGIVSESVRFVNNKQSSFDHIYGRTMFINILINKFIAGEFKKFDETFVKYLLCACQVVKVTREEQKVLAQSEEFGPTIYVKAGIQLYEVGTDLKIEDCDIKNHFFYYLNKNNKLVETKRLRSEYIIKILSMV